MANTSMPFGLANAPVTFQRFINLIFKPLVKIDTGKVLLYLDNILIATRTVEDHLWVLSKF